MSLVDRLYRILYDAHERYLRTSDIVDALYGDQADGGPLSADNIVRCTIFKLRDRGVAGETDRAQGYRIVDRTSNCLPRHWTVNSRVHTLARREAIAELRGAA